MNKIKKSTMLFILFALFLTLSKLTAYAEAKDYVITSAGWDEGIDKVMAIWDEAADKTSYRVQLYKGNKKIGSTVTANSDKYNFSKQVADNGSGTYYFTVYPSKGGKSLMVKSEALSVDSEYYNKIKEKYKKVKVDTNDVNSGPGFPKTTPKFNVSEGVNGWNQIGTQWWFKNEDGSYAKQTWREINNKWYYFDEDGIMKTGWYSYQGSWYYLNTDGDMLIDAITPDGYKVGTDGVWVIN